MDFDKAFFEGWILNVDVLTTRYLLLKIYKEIKFLHVASEEGHSESLHTVFIAFIPSMSTTLIFFQTSGNLKKSSVNIGSGYIL